MDRSSGWGLVFLGFFLCGGLIGAAWVVGEAVREARAANQTVEVKGFAERRIASDHAVWTGRFTARGPTLADAYAKLEKQREAVLAFLTAQGVQPAELEVSPVLTDVLYRRDPQGNLTNQIEGYALSHEVRVAAPDVDRVSALAGASAELVKQGIELSSNRPEYFYTKLGELKIAMLAEATEDARKRAEALATGSGSHIGRLRSAEQGVFQITPALSTEVSDYGQNDTSSREKSIKAVVTIRYSIAD